MTRQQTSKVLMWLGVLAIAALLRANSLAGPVEGPEAGNIKVPSAQKEESAGEYEFTKEFRSNERASVVILGDHRPVVDLEIAVYHVAESGVETLVTRDGGAKDLVGVTWVPPRNGRYRVVIRNPVPLTQENPYNLCWMVVR